MIEEGLIVSLEIGSIYFVRFKLSSYFGCLYKVLVTYIFFLVGFSNGANFFTSGSNEGSLAIASRIY